MFKKHKSVQAWGRQPKKYLLGLCPKLWVSCLCGIFDHSKHIILLWHFPPTPTTKVLNFFWLSSHSPKGKKGGYVRQLGAVEQLVIGVSLADCPGAPDQPLMTADRYIAEVGNIPIYYQCWFYRWQPISILVNVHKRQEIWLVANYSMERLADICDQTQKG